ncbi:hypothetical protein C3L33_17784, partial [Rhododendron williamsianum]
MHHGGDFGDTISQTYIRGSVSTFDYCHGDELSMLELSTMGKELGYGFDSRFCHKLNGQFVLMQTDEKIMNLAYVVNARRVVHIYLENAIVVGTQVSQICSNTLRPTIGKDVVIEDDYNNEYDPDSSSSEDDSDVVFNDSDYNLTHDNNEFEANVDKDIEFVGLSDKAEIDQSYAETIQKLANIDGDCDGGSSSELSSGMEFKTHALFRDAVKQYAIKCGKVIKFLKSDRSKVRTVCKDNVFRVKTFEDQHTCTRTYHVPWVSTTWICNTYKDRIRSNPTWPYKSLAQTIEKEWTCKVSLTRVYSAKQKALDLIEGTTNEQFGMLYAYAEEIMKTNPGTRVTIKANSPPVEVQTVDVQGAKELITSGHRYLDVR